MIFDVIQNGAGNEDGGRNSPLQLFLGSSRNAPGEERCVTSLKTAAKETKSAETLFKTAGHQRLLTT